MQFDDLIYIMHCEITTIIKLINILIIYIIYICFVSGLAVKNLPPMQETQDMWVRSLGREDPYVSILISIHDHWKNHNPDH